MNQSRKMSQWWGGLFSLIAMVMAFAATTANADVCLRESYGRSVGKVPTACADADRAMDEGLCYKKCEAGWDGKATSCVQNCPAGFKDDGALLCIKPDRPAPYGVGAGYPWKLGDTVGNYDKARDRCNADNKQGCTRDGLLWYPNCRAGFYKSGALICSPDEIKCPSGFADLGLSCGKKTTDRGVGIVPNACAGSQELETGLCFERCKTGFIGSALSCRKPCPSASPYACGGGFNACGRDGSDCMELFSEPMMTLLSLIVKELNTAGAAAGPSVGRIVSNGLSTLKGLNISDWFSSRAGRAGVTFAQTEIAQLKLLFDGGAYDPREIDAAKLQRLVQTFKKPAACSS